MNRRLLRALAAMSFIAAAAFFVLCWLASSRLICPARRAVQDYHKDILEHTLDHGMSIVRQTLVRGEWTGTPCLVCEPLTEPGAAGKGNKLRTELEARNVPVQSWGRIIGTLVLLHGHTGRKEDHLPVAERFCAAGFRCILIDLPGHGGHPAPFASFGFRETSLPLAALRELSESLHFEMRPACLFGISQGGAIALQAAAADPGTWSAVAELSSFADLDGVIGAQASRLFGPLHSPARFIVSRLVKWRAGFDPAAVRPADAAALLGSVPVLIGHGTADTFVPTEHARALLAAVKSERKEFLEIAGTDHHDVLITSQPVYATVAKFFLEALAATR
ncbi:MAG: alpha/beta fold hydrolase [Verrucomicrobiaceae bacterium]|nr:alpha/beta fold hydrolase [Verrucomicrobiaceae bacterium]